jgi:hypothetical protein
VALQTPLIAVDDEKNAKTLLLDGYDKGRDTKGELL